MRKENLSILGFKRNSAGFVPLMLLIMIVVVLFLFAIGFTIIKKIVHEVRTDTDADPDIHAFAKEGLQQYDDNFSQLYDSLFVFIFSMLLIVLIVASSFIEAHPIFIIILIVLMIPLTIIGMSLANAHNDIMNEEFSTEASGFPMTAWIMSHLPMILIICVVLVGIGLFSKRRIYG
jgi:NADH:ubiquinone oxidoreductase subunit 5 (subunit L)/multisubunit Na+/H+ antiporter MnhA subunit